MEYNTTDSNITQQVYIEEISLAYAIPVGIILILMIIVTATGNILVVTAVIRERQLHTLANRLIASLAVTDLMVALLDLHLAASAVLVGHWPFGHAVCDFFITIDVLLCTNSILHLVAISIDRYWTVTDISYTRGNQKQRYFFPVIVTTSWLLSAAVCLPPFFGWKTDREFNDNTCIISQDKGYTIYSTVTAFYLPLLVIIIIYTKIFLVVRSRVRKKQFNGKKNQENSEQNTIVTKLDPADKNFDNYKSTEETTKQFDSEPSHSNTSSENYSADGTTMVAPSMMNMSHDLVVTQQNGSKHNTSVKTILKRARRKNHECSASKAKRKEVAHKQKVAQKRERKALRTLLLITGVFIICWLPFFIYATAGPFCGSWCEDHIPKIVGYLVNWLGYSNSLLNPIIYTIFSPDFRMAFRKILFR